MIFNVNVLATGSKGNAVAVNDILIDCGVPFSTIKDFYKNIRIVLLTHKHSDHFNAKTIKRLSYERPSLRFACAEYLADYIPQEVKNLDVLQIGKKYDYGDFIVSAAMLQHDVPNVAWKVYMGGEKMIYATDTNTLDNIKARNYDLYLIEANYDKELAIEEMNHDTVHGSFSHIERAIHNHLSKQDCDEWFNSQRKDSSVLIYLHQHRYNGVCLW